MKDRLVDLLGAPLLLWIVGWFIASIPVLVWCGIDKAFSLGRFALPTAFLAILGGGMVFASILALLIQRWPARQPPAHGRKPDGTL